MDSIDHFGKVSNADPTAGLEKNKIQMKLEELLDQSLHLEKWSICIVIFIYRKQFYIDKNYFDILVFNPFLGSKILNSEL